MYISKIVTSFSIDKPQDGRRIIFCSVRITQDTRNKCREKRKTTLKSRGLHDANNLVKMQEDEEHCKHYCGCQLVVNSINSISHIEKQENDGGTLVPGYSFQYMTE